MVCLQSKNALFLCIALCSSLAAADTKCSSPGYALLSEVPTEVVTYVDHNSEEDDSQLDSPVESHEICLVTRSFAPASLRGGGSLHTRTLANKRAYADKHKYRLFDETQTSLDTSRPAPWSKIKAAKRLMLNEACEWVVWMESDVVIINADKPLQDILPAEKDFVVTHTGEQSSPYNDKLWLIRNSVWSHQFLDDWWKQYDAAETKNQAVALGNHLDKDIEQMLLDIHVGVPPACIFETGKDNTEWMAHAESASSLEGLLSRVQ